MLLEYTRKELYVLGLVCGGVTNVHTLNAQFCAVFPCEDHEAQERFDKVVAVLKEHRLITSIDFDGRASRVEALPEGLRLILGHTD